MSDMSDEQRNNTEPTLKEPRSTDKGLVENFLTPHGRLNRKRYIKRTILLGCIELFVPILLLSILFAIIGSTAIQQMAATDLYKFIPISIFYMLFLIPAYCLDARRLEDIGKGPALAAGLVLINIAVQVVALAGYNWGTYLVTLSMLAHILLMALKGNAGTNSYGPDPLQALDRH